jgi:hypothetical protein
LVLDQYGYVVDIDNVGVNDSDMMFVIDYFQGLHDGRLTTMLRGVLVDGTVVTGRVAAGNTYPAGLPVIAPGLVAEVRSILDYRFGNNMYTLNAAQQSTPPPATATRSSFIQLTPTAMNANSNIASGAVRLTAANSGGHDNIFARDVRFIYIHGANNTVTVREGVQRVPTIAPNSFAVVEERNGVPVVVAVFLNNTSPVGVVDRARLLFVPTTMREAGNVWVGDDLLERFPAWVNAESIGNVIVDPDSDPPSQTEWFYTFSINTRDGQDVYLLEWHYGDDTISRAAVSTVESVVGSSVMLDQVTPPGRTIPETHGFRITSETRIVDTRSPAAQDARRITPTARGLQVATDPVANGGDGFTVTLGVLYDGSTGGTGNASVVYIIGATGP